MARRKLAISLFTITAYTGTVAFRMSMPAIAFYAKNVLEASMLGIGLLTSSFFIARGITAIIAGGLTDKLRSKMLVASTAGFLLNALVVQLYPAVANIYWLLLLRFVQGVLNGFAWVPIQALLGFITDKNIRGRIYSIYFILGALGALTGNLIYSALSSAPLTHILVISSIFFILSSIKIVLAKSMIGENVSIENQFEKRGQPSARHAVQTTILTIIPLILVVFSSNMFSSILKGDLIYVYLNMYLGLSKSIASLIIGFAGVIVLPVNYMISWIADKKSGKTALEISLAIGIVGGLLLSMRNPFLAVSGLILAMIGGSSIVPITRKLAVSIRSYGGTGIGIINTSGNIGSMTGSAIAGLLFDRLSSIYLGGELVLSMMLMVLPLFIAIILVTLMLKENY